MAVVAGNCGIVCDTFDDVRGHPANPQYAVFVVVTLGIPAAANGVSNLRAANFPWIPKGQPLVGVLHLPAVANLLTEEAKLITDSIADRGDAQGSNSLRVARRSSDGRAGRDFRRLRSRPRRIGPRQKSFDLFAHRMPVRSLANVGHLSRHPS